MMMKSLLVLFAAVTILVSTADAALAFSLPNTVPGHDGKCWDDNTKIEMCPGDKRTDRAICQEIFCNDDLSMRYSTCGSIQGGPGCHKTVGDLTKDYPQCCPTLQCN